MMCAWTRRMRYTRCITCKACASAVVCAKRKSPPTTCPTVSTSLCHRKVARKSKFEMTH